MDQWPPSDETPDAQLSEPPQQSGGTHSPFNADPIATVNHNPPSNYPYHETASESAGPFPPPMSTTATATASPSLFGSPPSASSQATTNIDPFAPGAMDSLQSALAPQAPPGHNQSFERVESHPLQNDMDPFAAAAPPPGNAQPDPFASKSQPLAAADSLFGPPKSPTPSGRVRRSNSTKSEANSLFSSPPSEYSSNADPFATAAANPDPFNPTHNRNTRSQSTATPTTATTTLFSASHPSPSPPLSQKSTSSTFSTYSTNQPIASVGVIGAELSVQDLVDEFTRNMPLKSPPTPIEDLPNDLSTLEGLYVQKRWRSLTRKALRMLQPSPPSPREVLKIKSWWLVGLIREEQYDNAASVLEQLGDLDSTIYEPSDENDSDLFVVTRIKLLDATLSKCRGLTSDHESKLLKLLSSLEHSDPHSGKDKWIRITVYTLINHFLQQQRFPLAIRLCKKLPTASLTSTDKVVQYSRLCRIHLQMGNLDAANKLVSLARETLGSSHDLPCLEARVLVDEGLVLFATNQVQESLSAFDAVLRLVERDGVPEEAVDLDEQLLLDEDVACSAVNNFAVCALYCCDVRGAIAALERAVRCAPERFLQPSVVFNISSLYDLVFDGPTSSKHKEKIQVVSERCGLEHLQSSVFRI